MSADCFPTIFKMFTDFKYQAQCHDADCEWRRPMRDSRMEAAQDGRDHRNPKAQKVNGD